MKLQKQYIRGTSFNLVRLLPTFRCMNLEWIFCKIACGHACMTMGWNRANYNGKKGRKLMDDIYIYFHHSRKWFLGGKTSKECDGAPGAGKKDVLRSFRYDVKYDRTFLSPIFGIHDHLTILLSLKIPVFSGQEPFPIISISINPDLWWWLFRYLVTMDLWPL